MHDLHQIGVIIHSVASIIIIISLLLSIIIVIIIISITKASLSLFFKKLSFSIYVFWFFKNEMDTNFNFSLLSYFGDS